MPKADSREWPKRMVDSLSQLAKDGYSAREIVDRLLLEGFKTTRNAVLGVANRRKIKVGVVSGAGYLQSTRFGRKPILKCTEFGHKAKYGKMIESGPPTTPLPDRNLCHWPTGDTWCGCKVVDGKPYCATHCATAYNGKWSISEGDLKKLLGLI